MTITFKDYLIEEDRIAIKLRNIEQALTNQPDKEEADTPIKQDRKFHLDRNRYSKMARKVRNQQADNTEFDNPEGMKTGGGSTFSG